MRRLSGLHAIPSSGTTTTTTTGAATTTTTFMTTRVEAHEQPPQSSPLSLRGNAKSRGGTDGSNGRVNPIGQTYLNQERRQEQEGRATGSQLIDDRQNEGGTSGPIWRSARDPVSGRVYYFDLASQRSQWAKPPEVAYATERMLAREVSAESDSRKFFREMERNIYRKLSRLPRAMIERRPGAVARRLVRTVSRGGLRRGVENRSLAPGAFRQPPPSPIQVPQKLEWKRSTRASTSAFVKFVPLKKCDAPPNAMEPAVGQDGTSIQRLSHDGDKSPERPEQLERDATMFISIPRGHQRPSESALVTPCLQRPRSDSDMTTILVNFATVYRNRILVASDAASGDNCSSSPVSVDQLREASFVFCDAWTGHHGRDGASRNVGNCRDDDDDSSGVDGHYDDCDSSLDDVPNCDAWKDSLEHACRHGAVPMQISSACLLAMSPICTHASCSTLQGDSCCPPDQAVLGMQRLGKTHDKPPEPPSVQEVVTVLSEIFSRGQLEDEAVAITLIYVDRLSHATRGRVHPSVHNWKSILVVLLILASKVWDDLSMSNGDFACVCESWLSPPVSAATTGYAMSSFTLRRINQLERAVLTCLDFDVSIRPAQFQLYDGFLRVKGRGGYGKGRRLRQGGWGRSESCGTEKPLSWTSCRQQNSLDRHKDHHMDRHKEHHMGERSADFHISAMRRTKSI